MRRNRPDRKLSLSTFRDLPISEPLQAQLASAGFTTPTPVQVAAIPQALEGKDVLATAATGTGKTLAFVIPMVQRLVAENPKGVAALVLVPTRELAMQVAEQFDKFRGKKLKAAALVVGGLSEKPQLMAIRRGAQVIVATPGRLEDYIGRRLVDLRQVRMLVLDEADRMLDMGFIPAIRRIVGELPRDRQTMCFSATLEPSVARLVQDCMRNPVRVALGSTLKPAANVLMQAFEVPLTDKRGALHKILSAESGRCIIFARTKRGTERLAKSLVSDGFRAAMIHGDRSQSQRTAALTGFQQGKFQILVATDVASRGIHVQDIAHVINYDLPQIAEDFVHRVGRTARAGSSGLASTLYASHEGRELKMLESALGIRMERKRLDGSLQTPGVARRRAAAEAQASAPSRIGRLPGEFFQGQGQSA